MKKYTAYIIAAVLAVCLSGCAGKPVKNPNTEGYDRKKAVAYALEYARKRNPDYPSIELNCTNFVSQCLTAGGKKQDQGKMPEKGHGIRFDSTSGQWYSKKKSWSKKRPASFRVSSTFVRTKDFFDYWTKVRGLKLKKYENTFKGRAELIKEAVPGDIFIFYGKKGEIVHFGVITEKSVYDLFFSANTKDRKNFSICDINSDYYPEYGVLFVE